VLAYSPRGGAIAAVAHGLPLTRAATSFRRRYAEALDRPGTIVAVAFSQTLVPMQPVLGKPFHRPGGIYEETAGACWPSRMASVSASSAARPSTTHNRFRELADAIPALTAPTLILDGEVCVFDKDRVSQFHLLDRLTEEPCTPAVFMASTVGENLDRPDWGYFMARSRKFRPKYFLDSDQK
jgi:hypothetical protein